MIDATNKTFINTFTFLTYILLFVGLVGCDSPSRTSTQTKPEKVKSQITTTKNGLKIKFTDLGGLGGRYSYAYSINEHGKIVGSSTVDSSTVEHAVLWENGNIKDLNYGGRYSTARDINDKGKIVGTRTPPGGDSHEACLWSNGKVIGLCKFVGRNTTAFAINYNNLITGDQFLFDNGTATSLKGAGWDVNDQKQIVGDRDVDNSPHPFLLENGDYTDLGTLGGASGSAESINNQGQIVGYARNEKNDTHAFLWEDGKMTDLGILGNAKHTSSYSRATDINDNGQIVGYSISDSGKRHAFLWEDGTMIDIGLKEIVGRQTRTKAEALNGKGQIVGWMSFLNSSGDVEFHAVLWEIMD